MQEHKKILTFCLASALFIFAITCGGCRKVRLSEQGRLSDKSAPFSKINAPASTSKKNREVTAGGRTPKTGHSSFGSETAAPNDASPSPAYQLVPVDPETLQPKKVETYEVRKGDTLREIARKLYDQPEEWKIIFKYNQNKLETPNALPAGITLQIPPLP